jgi:hypothetical protein
LQFAPGLPLPLPLPLPLLLSCCHQVPALSLNGKNIMRHNITGVESAVGMCSLQQT